MRSYLVVATGASIGASIRWAAGEAITRPPGSFPWATLLVNLVGCVLIGAAARHLTRTSWRWFAGVTGLLGGLTTYSTFAVETRELVDAGRGGAALAYVAVSVIGGLAAVEVARGDWGRSG
jgi:CrcB protein